MKGISFYNTDFFNIKEGNNLIKENITRILLTQPGERINNPQFGSNLKSFIFDPENVLKNDVVRNLEKSINRWEPRVNIGYIDTKIIDQGKVEIHIELTNRNTLEEFTYETIIRY